MSKLYNVTVNGTTYEVEVEEIGEGKTAVSQPAQTVAAPKTVSNAPSVKTGSGTPVNAPMQGNIIKVAVSVGQTVKKGDLICLLEAMKMENEIFAPCDGKITSVAVNAGQTVSTGAVIATIA